MFSGGSREREREREGSSRERKVRELTSRKKIDVWPLQPREPHHGNINGGVQSHRSLWYNSNVFGLSALLSKGSAL